MPSERFVEALERCDAGWNGMYMLVLLDTLQKSFENTSIT